MYSYLGCLVVLRSQWNINSTRVGLVIEQEEHPSDLLVVMWTTKDGIILKKHIQHAVLPITDKTLKKVEERICDIE